jgi:hypothetical protein
MHSCGLGWPTLMSQNVLRYSNRGSPMGTCIGIICRDGKRAVWQKEPGVHAGAMVTPRDGDNIHDAEYVVNKYCSKYVTKYSSV